MDWTCFRLLRHFPRSFLSCLGCDQHAVDHPSPSLITGFCFASTPDFSHHLDCPPSCKYFLLPCLYSLLPSGFHQRWWGGHLRRVQRFVGLGPVCLRGREAWGRNLVSRACLDRAVHPRIPRLARDFDAALLTSRMMAPLLVSFLAPLLLPFMWLVCVAFLLLYLFLCVHATFVLTHL